MTKANLPRSTNLQVSMQLQGLDMEMRFLRSQRQAETGTSTSNLYQHLGNLVTQVVDREHRARYGLQPSQNNGNLLNLDAGSQLTTTEFTRKANLEHRSRTRHNAPLRARGPELLSTSSRDLQLQLRLTRRCKPSCYCSCHRQRELKSSSILNRVLGSLFMSHSAIPTLPTGRCDTKSCLSHSTAAIKVFYVFPYWALRRAIYLTMAYHQGQFSNMYFEQS